jgi:hypothetical protein
MIQRIQTLYLFIAAILSSLAAFFLPMYSLEGDSIFAYDSMWIWFVFGWSMTTFSAAILMYQKRSLQLLLVRMGMLSSLIVLGLLLNEISKTDGAAAAYGAVVPMLNIVFAFLASRGIQKDEAKIKSLDRLR